MRKRRSIFNSAGFTLLELIIVFSVISILSTIGIASFVDYSRLQVIQSAASNLEATVNMAKSRALSQTKPLGCESQILQGYEVVLDTVNKPNSYAIWAVCSDFLVNPFGTATNKTFLPTSVSFDLNKTTTNSIFFPVLTSGIKGSGVIALTGYGQTRCVSMGGGALVELQVSTCAPIATPTPTPIATFNPTPSPTPAPSISPTPTPVPSSVLFVYTGSMQTWNVPLGVSQITIDALGAAGKTPTGTTVRYGGGTLGGIGGFGGEAKGTFAVTPGQAVYIYVGASSGYNGGGTGAAGSGGGSGGSGGGASDIRMGGTALSNRVLVAGGGGGGGGYYQSSAGGAGGVGGGFSGGNGGGGCCFSGGNGGTQTAGGTGGTGSYGVLAGSGTLGVGGNGKTNTAGGGGGGGGYYGGGGGGGGAGGGGSSFISSSATNASTVSGVEQYYGQITISY